MGSQEIEQVTPGRSSLPAKPMFYNQLNLLLAIKAILLETRNLKPGPKMHQNESILITTMTDTDLKLFQQAVTLARKPEQRPAAYARFKQLERKYPDDMFVLIWVAYTSLDSDPTLTEAETALARASQVAAIPGDEALLDAYDWLAQQRQFRNERRH